MIYSKSHRQISLVLFVCGFFIFSTYSFGQSKTPRPSLKDSLDGKIDFSDWIIEANGFIPIPILITEPALGGVGGMLGLAFLNKVPNSPPNLTMGFGGYTANSSWFLGGIHSHNIPEKGIRYQVGTMYSDVNISLYRDVLDFGEQEFKFNFKLLPVFMNGIKKIGDSNWYLGGRYIFIWNRVGFNGELPDFVPDAEVNSIVSNIGPVIEFDNRDNTFTPNKGNRFRTTIGFSDSWTGSDYTFIRLNMANYSFFTLTPKWILGVRAEYQQVFEDPPFFLLPGINLRGVPAARYQGKQTALTEIENRFDFGLRWSLMAFGGLAKAFDGADDWSQRDLVYNVGTGVRYLLARKFGVRMGMDIAVGPESWGYYIVFGSNWLR